MALRLIGTGHAVFISACVEGEINVSISSTSGALKIFKTLVTADEQPQARRSVETSEDYMKNVSAGLNGDTGGALILLPSEEDADVLFVKLQIEEGGRKGILLNMRLRAEDNNSDSSSSVGNENAGAAGAALFRMFEDVKGVIDRSVEQIEVLQLAMLKKDETILRTTNTLTKLTDEREKCMDEAYSSMALLINSKNRMIHTLKEVGVTSMIIKKNTAPREEVEEKQKEKKPPQRKKSKPSVSPASAPKASKPIKSEQKQERETEQDQGCSNSSSEEEEEGLPSKKPKTVDKVDKRREEIQKRPLSPKKEKERATPRYVSDTQPSSFPIPSASAGATQPYTQPYTNTQNNNSNSAPIKRVAKSLYDDSDSD